LTDMPRVRSWGAIRRSSLPNVRGDFGQRADALTLEGTSLSSWCSMSVADKVQFDNPSKAAQSSRTSAKTDFEQSECLRCPSEPD
jgi:hypothetical protein